jgi:acetyl-CoA synthetase (ADP-forming)/acetyltransferase
VEDYLGYFGSDDKIKIIAAYIEDIKDGKSFFSLIKKIAREKLIIVLKGGSTEQGAIAAKSHTGAMSGSSHVFTAVMRQAGCILVETLEELVDVVMLATPDGLRLGPRVGFLGCGGGTSVTFTDMAAKQGLILPKLNESTQQRIREKISIINTSTTNPVDLGAFGFDFEIMTHTMKAMAADDNLDVIIPHFTVGMMPVSRHKHMKFMVDTARKLKKPVIAIVTKATEDNLIHEEARLKLFSMFRDIQIPVYGNIQDAAVALRYFLQWRTINKGIGSNVEL